MNLPLSVFKSEPSYSAVSFIPRGGRTNVHYRDSVTRSSTLFFGPKNSFWHPYAYRLIQVHEIFVFAKILYCKVGQSHFAKSITFDKSGLLVHRYLVPN